MPKLAAPTRVLPAQLLNQIARPLMSVVNVNGPAGVADAPLLLVSVTVTVLLDAGAKPVTPSPP